jgi:tRNA threonylcarbamoyladenosine biosynthesis protein TsaE
MHNAQFTILNAQGRATGKNQGSYLSIEHCELSIEHWALTTFVTHSEEETQRVARELTSTLHAGDVLLLSGDLGAGKTTFVRGLAEGLGIDPGEVSSPTFTLIHEYRGGRLPLFHADLYRLTATATEDIGLEEMGANEGVLAIEWPERLAHALPGARTIHLETVDEKTRRVTVDSEAGIQNTEYRIRK